MSNELIQWSMFFAPWLTMFFMRKEDIKRYMPVGLLAIVATVIIHDIGTALGFWVVRESSFPLYHMLPYFFGNLPVLSMWIFKFTYSRIWLYIITNVVFDIVFSFLFLGKFLPSRGIYELVGISSFQVLLINFMHMLLLYGYQMWQDDIFTQTKRTKSQLNLQPAAAKQLPKNEDKQNKED
ncbi:hypothetical protein [Pelosinus sp. UFO1]|uniref:hypothetical protein n=1 Tax=Pelosinus sp. UFO1 TaxID=484770 RepID=UPI0004D14208|nr:hypothetical protein [Pelosinus sp. UFO1]AIF51170.1 hypothetical protein UFO1_1619 [Pelosinus sp. UFO1]